MFLWYSQRNALAHGRNSSPGFDFIRLEPAVFTIECHNNHFLHYIYIWASKEGINLKTLSHTHTSHLNRHDKKTIGCHKQQTQNRYRGPFKKSNEITGSSVSILLSYHEWTPIYACRFYIYIYIYQNVIIALIWISIKHTSCGRRFTLLWNVECPWHTWRIRHFSHTHGIASGSEWLHDFLCRYCFDWTRTHAKTHPSLHSVAEELLARGKAHNHHHDSLPPTQPRSDLCCRGC